MNLKNVIILLELDYQNLSCEEITFKEDCVIVDNTIYTVFFEYEIEEKISDLYNTRITEFLNDNSFGDIIDVKQLRAKFEDIYSYDVYDIYNRGWYGCIGGCEYFIQIS